MTNWNAILGQEMHYLKNYTKYVWTPNLAPVKILQETTIQMQRANGIVHFYLTSKSNRLLSIIPNLYP